MPITIIAELGINHNADLSVAKRMIDIAASAGCDYVKLQKRNPDICVPEDQKGVLRDTPWGRMSYLDYRWKMEFGLEEFEEIDVHCKSRGIKWFASAFDIDSLSFLKKFNPDYIKVPSPLMDNLPFLNCCRISNVPIIMSTGMCDHVIISTAILCAGKENVACVMHCTSTYPTKTEELNLNCISDYKKRYPFTKIGFSNHHPGLIFMPVAVGLGAEMIEFHLTLDRSMWGTDQAASIEPEGCVKLVKWIKNVESAMGDGEKRIYDSEIPIMKKLRKQ
jgi:N-acetylneuraminate synthase